MYSDDFYGNQIDLFYLNEYKNVNDGKYVLFSAINVNSCYAYAYYGENKETSTVLKFLEKFKTESNEILEITLDSGSEFTNKKCMSWI